MITVDAPEKKTVSVDLIRRARADLYIRPNEGRRKVYLIPRADDMNRSAQNALLKVMEEPPEYGAFLLLTENEEKLLPTVRSRSVCLQLSPLERAEALPALAKAFPDRDRAALAAAWERAGGYLGRAEELLRAGAGLPPQTLAFAACFARRDRLGLTELLVPLERWKRDPLADLLQQWIDLLSEALNHRAGLPGGSEQAALLGRSRTTAELVGAVRRLQEAIRLLEGNVSTGAVCGALQVWLDEVG